MDIAAGARESGSVSAARGGARGMYFAASPAATTGRVPRSGGGVRGVRRRLTRVDASAQHSGGGGVAGERFAGRTGSFGLNSGNSLATMEYPL